jgi:glutamate-1-semialdehyde aminotransferase
VAGRAAVRLTQLGLCLTIARAHTGRTFWFSAVPMVAALTSVALLEDSDGVAHMFARGDQLVSGLRAQGAAYSLPAKRFF